MIVIRDRTMILLWASLMAGFTVAAPSAVAQDRCSGTLCDLYYGGSAPEPAPPAAPTPLMVPSGGILGLFSGGAAPPPATPGTPASPATRPLVGVGGGGLAAMARGEPAQRCTGTLCDVYYGGPPPETTPDPPAGPAAEASTDPAAPEDVSPSVARARDMPAGGVRYASPRCVAPAADPWRCYR